MTNQSFFWRDFINIIHLDLEKNQLELIKACRTFYAKLMSASDEPGHYKYDDDIEFSDWDFMAVMSFLYLTNNFKEMQALRDSWKTPLGFTQELYIAFLFGGPIPKILFFLLLGLVFFNRQIWVSQVMMKYVLLKTNYWIWNVSHFDASLLRIWSYANK